MLGVYNNVWMCPYDLDNIVELNVEKTMGEHDKAYVKGTISRYSLSMFQNMMDGKNVVSMHFKQNDKEQLLFAGFISGIDVASGGDNVEVIMYLEGLTQVMDRKRAIVDYQDITKTNISVIREVMKSYPDISYTVNCGEKQIEDLLLQYDETDYEFIKRVLSQTGEIMYTTTKGKNGNICFGYKAIKTVDIEEAEYEMSYKDGITYTLESNDYYDLGVKMTIDNNTLVIKSAMYSYKAGMSVNTYKLGTEKSCKVLLMKNDRAIGVSLDGVILECKRDKVQVELNKSFPCDNNKRKWFSYSSPAASTDGSGWYCMPKSGEEIRLFCPTNDEKEAFVISAIRDGAKAQADSKPENKTWTNPEGEEIDFTESGVKLTSNGGAVTMDIKPDGNVDIVTDKDVNIYAGKEIVLQADMGMSIVSENGVSLVNDTGSSMTIDSDIKESAKRIRNNC